MGFSIEHGQTVGLVGESGSGKSSIGKAILGLVPPESGSIHLAGRNIINLARSARRSLSKDLQVVFQDPNSSLNPTRTIGSSLIEPLLAARRCTRIEALGRARDMLARVGMPADSMDRYPSAFSGGQRQRIAIARALVMDPKLIVCDEPVSALDLSVQAQVLNLMVELQARDGLSYLFISHDLSVVRYISHHVLVLQRGAVVEEGSGDQVWNAPVHPYTRALIDSIPEPDPARRQRRRAPASV
ncbi:ATP-binding cassette domain-containing protein [Sinomonas sp. G460-2]|uniref:ATP-binding cassette domain-containing protein n=1 Tax=Sinomonas sp. G460-2 TaxID=3393464 RepID=UPI0039EDE7FF